MTRLFVQLHPAIPYSCTFQKYLKKSQLKITLSASPQNQMNAKLGQLEPPKSRKSLNHLKFQYQDPRDT